jgi:hypothetical protein
MQKILLVGNDDTLLRTRAWLLKQTQTVEVQTTGPADLGENANEQEFALLVLCHSLDIPARLKVSAEAHRRWPQVRVMQVLKDSFGRDSSGSYADDTVLAGEPEQLVTHARTMLEGWPGSSRPATA